MSGESVDVVSGLRERLPPASEQSLIPLRFREHDKVSGGLPFWLQDPPAGPFLLFFCSLRLAWGPFSSPASIFGFLTHWDPWPWVEVRSGSVAKLSLGQLLHFRAFAFPSEKPSRDCSVAQSSGAARRVLWRNSWQLRELVEIRMKDARYVYDELSQK